MKNKYHFNHRLNGGPSALQHENFLLTQQHMVDTALRGKPPNKQLTDLLFLYSKKSLQGKPFQISNELAAARKRTITDFLLVLRNMGRPCRNLKFVTRQSIFEVAHFWYANGISVSTLKTRISHLNWLMLVLGKSERAVQKVFLKLIVKDVPVPPDGEESWSSTATPTMDMQKVLECLKLATTQDRFVGSQLHLIYHLRLSPREAMALKPKQTFSPTTSVLAVEDGTRSRKTRLVGPLNSSQIELILNAQGLMEGYKEDQTFSPNFTKKEARRRFNYFARKAGFSSATGGLTPDQLAKARHW